MIRAPFVSLVSILHMSQSLGDQELPQALLVFSTSVKYIKKKVDDPRAYYNFF
jgi:hypothetical protein